MLFQKNKSDSGEFGVFSEKFKYEKGFAKYYEENLKSLVLEFEEKRSLVVSSFSNRLSIALGFLGIFCINITIFGLWDAVLSGFGILVSTFLEDGVTSVKGISLVVLILLVIMAVYFVLKPFLSYKNLIKKEIFPKVFKFFGDFSYQRNVPNFDSEFKESEIIPRYDYGKYEDYISGSYKGVGIRFFESELIRSKGVFGIGLLKSNYEEKTVFKGMFIIFDAKKKFKGKTIILKDLGVMGNFVKSKFKELCSDFQNVKLEDPRFEMMFEVYSSDQVEARYLLTTSFMDRLIGIPKILQSSKFEGSFYENKLLLKISTRKNFFEPGSIFIQEDFVDDCKIILQEMALIFNIIDILRLDQDIGL